MELTALIFDSHVVIINPVDAFTIMLISLMVTIEICLFLDQESGEWKNSMTIQE
jgi:hypothetical protein